MVFIPPFLRAANSKERQQGVETENAELQLFWEAPWLLWDWEPSGALTGSGRCLPEAAADLKAASLQGRYGGESWSQAARVWGPTPVRGR